MDDLGEMLNIPSRWHIEVREVLSHQFTEHFLKLQLAILHGVHRA